MTISYSASGVIQTGGTATATTSAVGTANFASVVQVSSFSNNLRQGMIVKSPAILAGFTLASQPASALTFDRLFTTTVPSGTVITFEDSDAGLLTTQSTTTTAVINAGAVTTFTVNGSLPPGSIITSPASLANVAITSAVSSVTTNVMTSVITIPSTTIPTALASGTQITIATTPASSTGLTITDVGSLPDRQRFVNLTGSGNQFTVNGTYNIDANKNLYTLSATGNAGFVVDGASAILNIASTDTGYIYSSGTTFGNNINSGNRAITQVVKSLTAETFSGAITVVNGGTLNMNGTNYYGNRGWTLGNLGTSGTMNISNSTIRLGNTSSLGQAGGLHTIYNASNTGQQSLINLNNVNFSGYMKLLAVNPASTFNSVTWFKDIPTTLSATTSEVAVALGPYTSGTTTPNTSTAGLTLVGPKFGFTGTPTSYYYGHIGMGFYGGGTAPRSEGPIAVRNAVYGYEQGVKPLISKVADFGNGGGTHRAWLEFRKNIQITLQDATTLSPLSTGGLIGTYFEDSQKHTGAISHVQAFASGSGYPIQTTLTSNLISTAGGTGAQVSITTDFAGAIISVTLISAGSGYAFTNGVASGATGGINLTVNSTNFPTATTGSGGIIQLFPYARVAAEALSGCPSPTDNRMYIANNNGSGILDVTSTNSNASGVTTTTNPIPPSRASALTGVDVLLGVANNSFQMGANRFGQFLTDTRWAANGATNYSITIPLRSYQYMDNTLVYTDATATEALQQTATRTLFMTQDLYVQATGIGENAAATLTDITLVTPLHTRGPLVYGDTQGPLIQSTTGTLTVAAGTGTKSLNQIYAKTKYDYTRRSLATAAGTVAHQGFGIASFFTPVGETINATLRLTGNWDADLNNVVIGSGNKAFTSIEARNVTLRTQPSAANAYGAIARLVLTAAGATVTQPLTATTFAGLPSSGTILDTGGSLLSYGTGSTYTINQTGTSPIVFQNGTDTVLSKNINSGVTSRTTNVLNMELYQGTLNVDPGNGTYVVNLINVNVGTGLTVNKVGSGTGTVAVVVANVTGTVTPGTGVTIQSQSVITVAGLPASVSSVNQIVPIFLDSTGTTILPSASLNYTYTTPPTGAGSFVATITASPALQYKVVFWIDGCYPVSGNGTLAINTQNINLTAATISTTAIDFTFPLSAAETDLITRSTIAYTAASGSTPQIVTVNVPSGSYIANPGIPGTGGNIYVQPTGRPWRQTLWKIMAVSRVENIGFINALASGTVVPQFVTWSESGYIIQNGNTTTEQYVRFMVQKVTSNVNSQFYINCFADNTAGLKYFGFGLYQYATNFSDEGQSIEFQLNSTQSVLLSPSDQNAVAGYAVSGIVGTTLVPGPLAKVARGVEDASLVIPTTINIP